MAVAISTATSLETSSENELPQAMSLIRTNGQTAAQPATDSPAASSVDLAQRRDELSARFAELQCDLGGLAYEMAIRNHVRVKVLVQRAAILQDVDAELSEVERILHLEETGTAGSCAACGAPHSSGAVYCWQCARPLLEQVAGDSIST
jgi:hypothetical protein